MASSNVFAGKLRSALASAMCCMFAATQVLMSPAVAQVANTSAAPPPATSGAPGAIPNVSPSMPIVNPRASAPPSQMPSLPVQTQTTNLVSGPNAVHSGLVNMDLSSAVRSTTTANLINQSASTMITVGGRPMMVTPGMALTPAQRMAVYQVYTAGNQKLVVNSAGQATGGTFNIGAGFSDHIGSLVVPTNVKALFNAGAAPLNLTGNLENAGQIYGYSQNAAHNVASIAASNITNTKSGVITTVRQDSLHIPNLSLSITAANDFSNQGLIESAGSLSIKAGGTLANGSTSAQGPPATLAAASDINLFSGAGVIQNAGFVTSSTGSITLNTNADRVLSVDNAGGRLTALAGAINLRDAGYAGNAYSSITGGDLLSQALNLHAGNSSADVNVNALTGTVNANGLAAHVRANTDVLNLGTQCLVGDPTYYNSAGSINIAGNITVGEALTIIASQNITSANNVTIQAGDSTQGFPITLIAGANITSATGGSSTTSIGPIPPATGTEATSVTFNGVSATGGNIVLSTGTKVFSRATDLSGDTNGAQVLMAAYSLDAAGGVINFNSASVNSSGSGTGSGGDVILIAGDTNTGLSIVPGSITTNAASGYGGVVRMSNAQPESSNGLPITYQANGTLDPGSGFLQAGTLTNGSVVLAASINSGTVIINAGTSIVGGTINAQDVVLTAFSGNIGDSSGFPSAALGLGSSLTNLTASAPSGSVYISSPGRINLADSGIITNNALNDYYISSSANSGVAISQTTGAGLGATTLLLRAPNGGTIGDNGAPIVTDAANLTASSFGSVFLQSNRAGGVTLRDTAGRFNNVGAGNTFSLTALSDINWNGAASPISAGQTTLVSMTGNIGSVGTPIRISQNGSGGVTLTATTNGKSASVTSSGALDINGATVGDTINVTAANANITAPVVANTVSVGAASVNQTASGTVAATNLSLGISGGSSVLTAANNVSNLSVSTSSGGALFYTDVDDVTLTNVGGGGTLSSLSINSGGTIASTAPSFTTNGLALSASAPSGTAISITNPITVNGTASVSVNGGATAIWNGTDIVGTGDRTITGTGGSGISVTGALNQPSNTVSLSTSGSGNITQSAPITASTLNVTVESGSATLNNASNDVGTLAANSNGSGSVTYSDASALSLSATGGTGTLSTYSVTSAGALSVDGDVHASTFSGTGSSVATSGASKVVAFNTQLTATSGDIGSAGTPFSVDAALFPGAGLTLSAPAGSAYARDPNSVRLNSSSALNAVHLSAPTQVSVAGAVNAGSIALTSGTLNLGGDLVTTSGGIVLVASGNISTVASGVDISTSGTTGAPIVIAAGAGFVDNGTSVTITGTPGGGSINFDGIGTPLNSLTSNGTAGAGGTISLVAYKNGATGGRIGLPSAMSTINASGVGAANGDVIAIGNQTGGTTITLGAVTTSGGTAGTGNVSVLVANPNPIGPPGTVVINTNGASTGSYPANAFDTGATAVDGTVSLKAVTAGNNVAITTGGGSGFDLSSDISAGGTVLLTATDSGNITTSSGAIVSAPSVVINTSLGSIGTAANKFLTNASFLTASAGGVGSVFVKDTNTSVVLTDYFGLVNYGGTNYELDVSGNITNGAATPVQAPNIAIRAAGTIGSSTFAPLNISGNTNLTAQGGSVFILNGVNTVTLKDGGTPSFANRATSGIYWLSAGGGIRSATTSDKITADTVVLSSTIGSVGTSATPVQLNGDASVTASGRSVYIQNSTGGILLDDYGSQTNQATAVNGTYFIQAAGNINMAPSASSLTAANVGLSSTTSDIGSSGSLRLGGNSNVAFNAHNVTVGATNVTFNTVNGITNGSDGGDWTVVAIGSAGTAGGGSGSITNSGGSIQIGATSVSIAAGDTVGSASDTALTRLTATTSAIINGNLGGRSVAIETPSIINTGSIAASASGVLALNNSLGDLTIAPGGLDWSAPGGMTVSATGQVDLGGLVGGMGPFQTGGGSFTVVSGGNIMASGSGSGTIDTSSSTAAGGAISLISGATYSFSAASPSSLTVTGLPGTGNVDFSSGIPISLNANGTTNGGDVTLVAAGGVINLGSGSISSTGSTGGNVLMIAGASSGGNTISVNGIDAGAVALAAAAPQITASPGTVTYSNGSQTAGSYTYTTGTNGAINQAGGTISASALTTFSGSGNITLPTTIVPYFQTNTTGSVSLGNSGFNSGELAIGPSTAGAMTIITGGSSSTTGNITVAGPFSLTSSGVVNVNAISAGSVSLDSVTAFPFQLYNSGSISTTSGNLDVTSNLGENLQILGGGSLSASGGVINLTATANGTRANQLVFAGSQNFFGNAYLYATGANQSVVVTSNATVVGANTVQVNSPQLILQGVLIGNPLIFNSPLGAGTIANSSGDVNLPANLTFNGQSLAILASGSILGAATGHIDLTNSGGNGGSLTLVSGFTFTPATSGQVQDGIVYDVGGPSGGGSINLGGYNVNTTSTFSGGSAGSITAVAHGGSVNLGDLTANALPLNGNAGNIQLIGEHGVNVLGISTLGAVDGNVTISAAAPVTTSLTRIGDGIVITGGFGVQPGTYDHNIYLGGNVDAGSGNVVVTTGGAGAITNGPAATLYGGAGVLTAGSGGIGTFGNRLRTETGTLVVLAPTGNAYLGITGSTTFSGFTANSFDILSTGGITVAAPIFTNSATLVSDNNGSVNIFGGISGLAASKANFISITANGSGNISNVGQLKTSNLTVSSNTGNISVITNATDVTATTGGTVGVTDTATGTVAVTGSAGNSFLFTTGGALNATNVSGNGVTLNSGNNGSILLSGAIASGTGDLSITANGSGSITQSGATISGNSVSFASTSGNIGSAATPLTFNAPSATALTTGNVYLNSVSSVDLAGSNGGNLFELTSGAGITGTGSLSVGTLRLTANNGDINLSNPVVVNGASDLRAFGGGNISATIDAGPVVLTSDTGDITVVTDSTDITANTGGVGNVLITDNNGSMPVILRDSSAGGSFEFNNLTASNIHNINAGSILLRTGQNGSLTMFGNLTASGDVGIGLNGTGSLVGNGWTITGANVSLGTDTGNFGSASQPIRVAAGHLALGGSPTQTDAYINSLGALGLNASVVHNLNVTAGAVSVDQGVWATNLNIATTNNGDITLNNSLSGFAGANANSVILNANGSGNIIRTGGQIFTDALTLASGSGSMGSAFNRLVANASSVSLNTSGNAYLSNFAPTTYLMASSATHGTLAVQASGNLVLDGNLTAANVALDAGGISGITTTGGIINANSVSLIASAGGIGFFSSGITTNASSLSANAFGSVFLQDTYSGPVTLNSSSAGAAGIFNLSANASALTIGGMLGSVGGRPMIMVSNTGNLNVYAPVFGSAVFLTTSGSSNIVLSNDIDTSADLTLTTNSGNITRDSGIIAASGIVNISSVSGNVGTTTSPLITITDSFAVNTAGNVFVSNFSGNPLQIGSSTANNVTVSTLGATTVVSDVNLNGTLSLNTSGLTVGAGRILSVGTASIKGLSGSPFTLNNSGTIYATAGNLNMASAAGQELTVLGGGILKVNSGGSINLTATASGGPSSLNNLVFTGNQAFVGPAFLTASDFGQAVVINNATVSGNSTVQLNTCNLFEIGTGTITGSPLIMNCPQDAGTIANSSGDVNLTTSLVFNGKSLAILASGNVNATAPISIDLSNSDGTFNSGNGGNLTVVAGFNFSPSTGGQVGPNGTVYTINNNPSFAGGSINLGSVQVNTSSTVSGARGGDVFMVAHGGAINSGTINAGGIYANGTGSGSQGGTVNLIGQGGVSLNGTVSTTAGTAGDVNVFVAVPAPTSTIIDSNGVLSGGVFYPSAASNGNINVANMQGGTIYLYAPNGSVQSAMTTTVSGTNVNVVGGNSGVSMTVAATNLNLNTTGAAYIQSPSSVLRLTGLNKVDTLYLEMTAPSGSVVLDTGASMTSSKGININAQGTITQADNTALLRATGTPGVIALNATAGIGDSTQRVRVDGVQLNVNTDGDAFIDNFGAAIKVVGPNSANVFDVVSGNGLTLGNGYSISAASVKFSTAGSVVQDTSVGEISAPTLNIVSAAGSVGSSAQAIRTSASNVSVIASPSHDVYLEGTGTQLTLNTIVGRDISVAMTNPTSGSIVIAAGPVVMGANSVSLAASGNGTITGAAPSSFIGTPTLVVSTQGGDVGFEDSQLLRTNATQISVDATTSGDVFVETQAPILTLTGTNRADHYNLNNEQGGSIAIAAGQKVEGHTSVVFYGGSGDITGTATSLIDTPQALLFTTGNIGGGSAATALRINATEVAANSGLGSVYLRDLTAGDITLINSAYVNGAATTYELVADNAAGTGIQTAPGAIVTAPALVLVSNNGDVGADVNELRTSANSITVNTPNGNSFVNALNPGTVTLGTSADGFEYSGQNVTVRSEGSMVSAAGSLVRAQSELNLLSRHGDIGVIPAANPFNVDAAHLTLNAVGLGNSVFVSNTHAGSFDFVDHGTTGNAADEDFFVLASGAAGSAITITGSPISAHRVLLHTDAGDLGVLAGTGTAFGGALQINAVDMTLSAPAGSVYSENLSTSDVTVRNANIGLLTFNNVALNDYFLSAHKAIATSSAVTAQNGLFVTDGGLINVSANVGALTANASDNVVVNSAVNTTITSLNGVTNSAGTDWTVNATGGHNLATFGGTAGSINTGSGSINLNADAVTVGAGDLLDSATNVTINATALSSSSGILVDGNITSRNAGTVSLLSNLGGPVDATGTITAGTVVAESNFGHIYLGSLTPNGAAGAPMTLTMYSPIGYSAHAVVNGAVSLAGTNAAALFFRVSAFGTDSLNSYVQILDGATIAGDQVVLHSSQVGSSIGGIFQNDLSDTVTINANSVWLNVSGTTNGFIRVSTRTDELSVQTQSDTDITNFGSVLLGNSEAHAFALTTVDDGLGNSKITIDTGKSITADSVNLSSGASTNNGVTQLDAPSVSTISANSLYVSAATGGINLSTDVNTLQVSSTGNVDVRVAGDFSVFAASGDSISLTSPGTIQVAGDVSGGSLVSFSASGLSVDSGVTVQAPRVSGTFTGTGANVLNNQGVIDGTTLGIDFASAPGEQLVVQGGGVMTTGASGIISLTVTPGGFSTNELTFAGNQDFFGLTQLNAVAPSQAVVVNTGAVVTGHNELHVNSNYLIVNGTITGNPLVFNSTTGAGTIASDGNLDLQSVGPLTFHGKDLAILANGNITNSGGPLAIDLSGTVGNAGNLTLLAGFSFNPSAYPGLTGVSYTLTGNTLGSVALSNVSIDVSASANNSSAGNVFVAANGSVGLGNINASNTGVDSYGGTVHVIGNGISVGDIDESSPISGGVSLQSGAPKLNNTVIVAGGRIVHGFISADRDTLGGDISIADITAPGAAVNFTTGGTGSITFRGSNNFIEASAMGLYSGSGGIGTLLNPISTTADLLTVNATSAGDAYVNVAPASGVVSLFMTQRANNYVLNVTGGVEIGAFGPATIEGTSSVLIVADGAVVNADSVSAINTPRLVIDATTGGIGTSASPISTTASQLALNAHADDVNATTSSTAVTLLLNNGGNQFNLNLSGGPATVALGDALMAATVNVNTFNLYSLDSFSVSQGNPASLLTANNLFLTTNGGSFGSVGNPINTAVANLGIIAGGGDVQLSNTGDVSLFSNSGNNFSLTNAGVVSLGDGVEVGAIGAGSVSVTGTSIVVGTPASRIVSDSSLVLTATAGDLGSSSDPLVFAAQTLSATATGRAVLSNTGGNLTLVGSNSAVDYALNSGGITLGTLGTPVTVIGSNSITFDANSFDVTNGDSASFLLTPRLSMHTNDGSLGTSTSAINTSADNLSLYAGTLGDVYVKDSASSVTLGGTNQGNIFSIAMTDTIGSILMTSGAAINSHTIMLSTGSTGTLTVNSGGEINGVNVALTAAGLANNGLVDATAGLLINDAFGDSTISGSGVLLSGTGLTVASAGNLDISPVLAQYGASLSSQNVLFVAGGNLTASGSGTFTIDTSYSSQGGAVSMYAGAAYTLTAPLTLSIDGAASTAGGMIDFQSGKQLGSIKTTSSGGVGGDVTLIAFGNAGSVTLPTASSILTGGAASNGNVTISGRAASGTGIQVGTIDTRNVSGATVSGGNILLSSANPVVSNIVYTDAERVSGNFDLSTFATGNISANSLLTNRATIEASTLGSVTLTTPVQANHLIFNAINGSLSLPTSILAAQTVSADPNSDGGTIDIRTNNITYLNSAALPLTINAAGSGIGSGGRIDISRTTTNALTVGQGAGQYVLAAGAGALGGRGGSIRLFSGGNLTVNPSGVGFAATNGDGGSLALIAGVSGPGQLLVNGNLSANAVGTGRGGTILLRSNSSTVMGVGSSATKTNGLKGTVSALGAGGGGNGTFAVFNNGGGIKTSMSLTGLGSVLMSAGGSAGGVSLGGKIGDSGTDLIDLHASGTGTLTGTSASVLMAHDVSLSAGTGLIGSLQLNTPSVMATTGGTSVTLVNQGTAPLTVHTSQSANTFSVSSKGPIIVDGDITANKTITLTTTANNGGIALGANLNANTSTGVVNLATNGSGAIANSSTLGVDSINTGTLNLKSTSGAVGATTVQPLRINALNVAATTTGRVALANVGARAINFNGTSSKGFVSLVSNANITVAKTMTAASTYALQTTNGASILFKANVGSASLTNSILADADGAGNVTSSSTSIKLSTKNTGTILLSSDTGTIGTSSIPVTVSTANVAGNTAGSIVNFRNVMTGTTSLLDSTSGGTFTFKASSANTTINNVVSNANMLINTTAGTMTVANGANIIAHNGTLSLQGASSGSIVIGDNATIFTDGPGGGRVAITLGPVPTSPVAGSAPANTILINAGTTGAFYFGKNGISVDASGALNTLTIKNTDLVFNTGSRPSTAIVLGGGNNITADPPSPLTMSESTVNAKNVAASVPSLFMPIQSATIEAKPSTSVSSVVGAFLNDQNIVMNCANTAAFAKAPRNYEEEMAIINKAWVSETELGSGEIPAVIAGDNAVATQDAEANVQLQEGLSSAATTQKVGQPLTGGVVDTVGGKVFTLNKGSVVFTPNAPTLVHTPHGKVAIDADAVVLVMALSNGVAVYNLSDNRREGVALYSGTHKLALTPGNSAIITDNSVSDFSDINPAQMVLYRRVHTTSLANGYKVFLADFSVPSAVHAVKPLRKLLAGKDAKSKRLADRVLRTAAALSVVQSAHGQYTQVLRRKLTAFAP